MGKTYALCSTFQEISNQTNCRNYLQCHFWLIFFSSKKWNFRKLQIQENYNRSRHELKGALWIWIWKLYPGPWRIAIVWGQERQEPCHFAELETAKVDTISLEWHQKAEQEQLDTAPNAHGIHRNVASNGWKALYTSKRISVLQQRW